MFKYIFRVIVILSLGWQLQGQEAAVEKTLTPPVHVKVFPNPATTVLNVLGLVNAHRAHIVVTDQYGNTVLAHQWAIKNNALNLPIAELEQGLFMITIQSEKQSVQTKFYKQ